MNLNTFVADLYEELQFKCEPGGGNLPVGIRQKLRMAQALLRKSKIVLLDEAITEKDSIHEIIKNIFYDCTVLTIANNFNSILNCSK